MAVSLRPILYSLVIWFLLTSVLSAHPKRSLRDNNAHHNKYNNRKEFVAKPRVLTIIFAQTRTWELTWNSFHDRLLKPLDSDLAFCGSPPKENIHIDPFIVNANYTFYYPELEDWSLAYDEMFRSKDWRIILQLRDNLFGGIKDPNYEHPGSGGILLFLRWFLLKNIRQSNLLEKYDFFVITRSDYMYDSPHPLITAHTNKSHIFVPEGEDYHGITDRHMIVSNQLIESVLSIMDPFIHYPVHTYEAMKGFPHWNIEMLLKMHLQTQGLWDHVIRFPRNMYGVRLSSTSTRWSTGVYDPETNMIVKYASEFESMKASRTRVIQELS